MMRFSRKEIEDLLFAWIMISFAFAMLFTGVTSFDYTVFTNAFIISLLTAGIGFLFHELMHKYLAQKYGLWAEFRASYGMLWLALFFSLLGFIIAAPGAVILRGRLTRSQNGKISLAGPATNMALALLFLIPLTIIHPEGLLYMFLRYGLIINSLLGLFNLIPFPPFDGYKIKDWNTTIYTIALIIAIVLFGASYIL